MNLFLSHKIEIRVRYSETDKMGFCYHGNYAAYFEMGRVETLRHAGIVYRALEENGIMLPVVSLETQFKSPAKYDDLLLLETKLVHASNCTLVFNYSLYGPTQELITTAKTTLVFVNANTNKATRIPEYIFNLLKNYEVEQ